MRSLKIGAVQIDVSNRYEENLDKVVRGVDSCARKHADFILLPEMWLAGFDYSAIKKLSAGDCRYAIDLLGEKARKHSVHIIAGSIPEIKGKKVFNTSYVLGPDRVIGEYRKCHLFSPLEEQKHLASGDAIRTFKARSGVIGVMICYEIRFPEVARILALKGAEIIFVPAQFPKPRLNIWRALLAARAIENQLFIAACNRVGSDKKQSYFGHSLVADPYGRFAVEAGEDETELICDIDLGLIEKVRGEIQVFEDRRARLYGKYGI